MPDSPVAPARRDLGHEDEARLAQLAIEGDGEAFAALYDRHEQRVFNFCYRLTGSRDDAADATQEAFVRMLQRLPELGAAEHELNFGAYLLTVARHASYELTEKRRRAQPTEEIPETAGPVGGGGVPDPGAPEEDPDRARLLEAQQEEIRAANALLPERQREVLALRELEEMSYDDIASVMEMNRNSVAQLISRARINLHANLRRTAAEAVTAPSPDCERALPLLAMRQDGEPGDGDTWLDLHLASCDPCRVRVEAMAEAGASYRLWAPVVAFEFLRRETIAKAAELVGADWSEMAARGPGDGGSPGQASRAGRLASRLGLHRRDWAIAAAATLVALLLLLVAEVTESPLPEPVPAAEETPATTEAEEAEPAKEKKADSQPEEADAELPELDLGPPAPIFVPDTGGADEPEDEPTRRRRSEPTEDEPVDETTPAPPPPAGTTPTPPPPPPTDTTPTTPTEPQEPTTPTDPPRDPPRDPPQCFDPNGRPIPCGGSGPPPIP